MGGTHNLERAKVRTVQGMKNSKPVRGTHRLERLEGKID